MGTFPVRSKFNRWLINIFTLVRSKGSSASSSVFIFYVCMRLARLLYIYKLFRSKENNFQCQKVAGHEKIYKKTGTYQSGKRSKECGITAEFICVSKDFFTLQQKAVILKVTPGIGEYM